MSNRRWGSILTAVACLLLAGVGAPGGLSSADATTGPGMTSARLPVPAGAQGSGSPGITAISCPSAGTCVAVGYYQVPDATFGTVNRGLIETWSGGVWTPSAAPLPTGVSGPTSSALNGVSCFSSTTCAAYGTYSTATTTYQTALTFNGTSWKASTIPAPGGGAFPSPTSGSLPISGVGCTGEGACAIVGNVDVQIGGIGPYARAWWASQQGTDWTGGQITNTPADATSQGWRLNGMGCGGGLCQAAGSYVSSVGPEPLVVSIDPSTPSANAPSSHNPIPTGATEISGITGISCDGGGFCAAFGSYYASGGSGSSLKGLVMPVGGAAFQPQAPPTPTPTSTTIAPPQAVSGAGCSAGTCLVVGYYFDSSNSPQPLLDRFASGGGTADTAPNSNEPTLAACGSASFCDAIASTTYNAPVDVFAGSSWTAPALVLPADAAISPQSASEQATACDSSTSCWVLGTYTATVGNSGEGAAFAAHLSPTGAPPTGPSISSTFGMPAFALGSSTTFSWHGAAGSSAISHYAVEVRRAAWNGSFGSWTTPSGWGSLAPGATHVSVPLPVGDDTCVRVRATDAGALSSAWSSPRCTARPLDDHALTASSGWSRPSGVGGFYLGTYSSTKTASAALSRTSAEFDRLALVATKCATCGKVAVYSGTTLLTTINLYRASTLHEVVIPLSVVSLRTATIRLKVVSSGKLVQVDGLGISRT